MNAELPYGLGAFPSPADPLDHELALDQAAPLARRYVLGKQTPISLAPHLDQGKLPECGGYSGAGVKRYQEKVDGNGVLNLDPHWLYRRSRLRSGLPASSVGTTGRAVCATLLHEGIPIVGHPDTAPSFRIASYAAVPFTVDGFARALAQYAGPILVGMAWPENFFRPVKGVAPRPNEKVGGHLIDGIGYDLDMLPELFGCALLYNSWGDTWGGRGNVWVPFAYLFQLVHDLWKLLDRKD